MDKDKIEIKRGITDITNIMKHLEDAGKKARKEAWLKEHYRKGEAKND